jgi:hypothetical protein
MPNPNRLRCPNCRTRRTDPHAMVLHMLTCKQRDCTCGGYHFKHRWGSPLCVGNDLSDVRLAARQGEPDEVLEEILIDIAFDKPGQRSAVCPF